MSPITMNRIESALRVGLAYLEAYNAQDLDTLSQLLHDQILVETHEPAPHGTALKGKSQVLGYLDKMLLRYPFGKIEVEEVFGSGARGFIRWKYIQNTVNPESLIQRGVFIFKEKDSLLYELFSYSKGDW